MTDTATPKLVTLPINFQDERGAIQDIFGKDAPDSVTMIVSFAGAIRGNHIHKETVQHVFMLTGMMWAYTRLPGGAVERLVLRAGDLLRHDANEAHAYEAITDCTFLAFADGVRKGMSYEDDTTRVPSLVDEWNALQSLKR